MRYLVLASDYDGTLAHDGRVDEGTLESLERLVHSGRKLILVTGRELPDLESVFPRLDLCARVVAENGALLYNPATKEQRALAKAPPKKFIQALRNRGVTDFSVGNGIVATWKPHEVEALQAIRELGLELQIVFNKDAVMILPSGVNKSSGLCFALEELGLSAHNVVGVGDAENDHAFLDSCECPVAVANAIDSLKKKAVWVTESPRGDGVRELVGRLLENDLADLPPGVGKRILLGTAGTEEVSLPVYGRTVLVCGQSGSGKSSLIIGLVERIVAEKYQLCLVDPEGDYENLPNFRTLGSEKQAPTTTEVEEAVQRPGANVIVNLLGVAQSDRADRFSSLITSLQTNRLKTGRPHWIIIDEAHHVLPAEWALASAELNNEFTNVVLITVHPEFISPDVLKKMNTLVIVGSEPGTFIDGFGRATGIAAPSYPVAGLERGHALVWFVDENRVYAPVKIERSQSEHERHKRKYAEGKLEDELVFHFRGPDRKMDLRAHNLSIFVQLSEGIDDETWQFHLKRGDYSNWITGALRDSPLAGEIAIVEKDESLTLEETRARIVAAIKRKYTAPAN
jgi:hydroxymethylpyrimidine pyrophosphatase-like HAD family hydrolase